MRYKTVYLSALVRERTTVPYKALRMSIKLKVMEKYKTINLKLLIVSTETVHFNFIAYYAHKF